MRKAGLVACFVLFVVPVAAQASIEKLFRQFGLFGTWAADCAAPASPDNLHVTVSGQSGQILENHDIGPAGVVNRYRIVAARRMSATRLVVEVVFQPGSDIEEKQKLELRIEDGTRRTMLNQPRRGPPVVKDGIALAFGIETPVLKRCD
jgi:hypothetical protein